MKKWIVGVFSSILISITLLFIAPDPISKWSWNVLISIDQLANTVLGGDPDDSISSRLHRYKLQDVGWKQQLGNWGCAFLNGFDKNHCEKSADLDEGSRSLF